MKKSRKIVKRTLLMFMVMVMFMSSMTALAYDVHLWDGNKKECLDESCVVLYEKEYIDEYGDVYPWTMNSNGSASPYAFCIFHSYKDVTLVEHYVFPDGSCDLDFYDAVCCEKCGYAKSCTFSDSLHFNPCPHNY